MKIISWILRCLVALAFLVSGAMKLNADGPISTPATRPETLSGFASDPVPEWIWGSAKPKPGETFFFRRTFVLDGPIQHARLAGACDNRMVLYLNGRRVGEIENYDKAATIETAGQLHAGQNVMAVKAENFDGSAAFLLKLNVLLANGQNFSVVSDRTWLSSEAQVEGWQTTEFRDDDWVQPVSFGKSGVEPWGDPFDPTKAVDAYNSWKGSLGATHATSAGSLTLLPGFEVRLIRSAQGGEGSWISIAFDARGRLTIAREKSGLLRMTLDPAGAVAKVETINESLLECRGLLYAFDSLYVNANNSKALYRLRDTDGDDQFDDIKLLKETPGGVGHGRNSLVLGPDHKIYVAHGNNVKLPDGVSATSPHKNFQEDQLLPCPWDDRLFDNDVRAPVGHVFRIDPEGKSWELFAGGFRNPYDLAFNAEGELFTFDADMEWDTGAPWYRPNRVNHVVSGGEYGWRRCTGIWPSYYSDSLPSTLDIGLASPTGVKFGTGSRFPPKYQRALFVCDWAYGRIMAVHLVARGATYAGTAEAFLTGRPLNVTDIEFGPDGAMYFVTGGRGTQSGLYRVTYTGPEVKEPPKSEIEAKAERAAADMRALRRNLEAFHGHRDPQALDFAWPHLGHPDSWIRYAARIAVEHQDPVLWQGRALAENPTRVSLTALLALARVGPKEAEEALLNALARLSLAELSEQEKLDALRAHAIAFVRMGRPGQLAVARVRDRLASCYPDSSRWVNQEICRLLVYLEAPEVIPRTLDLLAAAKTQEEQMHYMFLLRTVRQGWTLEQRRAYFNWFGRAQTYKGGHSFADFIKNIQTDALGTLTAEERLEIEPRLAALAAASENKSPSDQRFGSTKAFVKNWLMEDLVQELEAVSHSRSFQGGKETFAKAQCLACHRLGNDGGVVGPDLTEVSKRFDRRAILESVLLPSKVIDEKYRSTDFNLEDGSMVSGQLAREDERNLYIRTALLTDETAMVPKAKLKSTTASTVSPMPGGLLDALTKEKILDLLAYVESGGDPNYSAFVK